MNKVIKKVKLSDGSVYDIEPAQTEELIIDAKNPTLAWNTTSIIGNIGGIDFKVTMPEANSGPKGATGATGPQGPKGDTGATGPKGSDATVTKAKVESVLTGNITSHTHSGYVTLAGGESISGAKTFTAANVFSGETQFTNASYAPT